jgi:PAS domain-containing protein
MAVATSLLALRFHKAVEVADKAKEELERSHQLLNATGGMAKVGGWELDLENDKQVWTEEVYKIHDLGLDYEPTGKKGIDFYAPEARPIISEAVKRAVEHGEPFDLELPMITAKGRKLWVHAIGQAHRLGGTTSKLSGTFQDITERRLAMDEIRRSEVRLRSLVSILQNHVLSKQELLDLALSEAIKLTDSMMGYIYFYNEGTRQFILNTWSQNPLKDCCTVNPQSCYELDETGVWGESVCQRKTIVINDFPDSHPLKKSYPEGHSRLFRFIAVPVFNLDKIIAVVSVANKESDYSEIDSLQFTLLMDSVWNAVERKEVESERVKLIGELKKALAEVKTLKGFIPICSSCKKIRDDKGLWNQLEEYISRHSDASFSHGICPDCMIKLYPQFANKNTGMS